MTPNPHRGSDFSDFLAEEGLMTPTMPPTKDLTDALRRYNAWRLGDWAQPMPEPQEITQLIDAAADRLDELEQVRQTLSDSADYLNRRLRDERALADRLAKGCDALLTGYNSSSWDSPMEKNDVDDCEQAIAAWKHARNPVPSEAEIDAHLNECVAKSALSWKPLPGDEP